MRRRQPFSVTDPTTALHPVEDCLFFSVGELITPPIIHRNIRPSDSRRSSRMATSSSRLPRVVCGLPCPLACYSLTFDIQMTFSAPAESATVRASEAPLADPHQAFEIWTHSIYIGFITRLKAGVFSLNPYELPHCQRTRSQIHTSNFSTVPMIIDNDKAMV